MSVIYGIIHTKGLPVEEAETECLRSNLSHVRFDREGRWHGGNAVMGVLLRQLLRNDAEQAPLCDGEYVVCADARLDNREELAQAVGIGHSVLPGLPDSRLILAAYRKWGADAPSHLLGDFAFVIYDQQRGRLFCARDHVGIRPFYYFWLDGTLGFCTLHPPLMRTCPVGPTPNDAFIVASFIRSYSELSQTVANEIQRLPPAHTLEIDAGGITVRRYWMPETDAVLQLGSDAEYAQAMREVFTRAVACRTRTDHRVGSHLSSGLDSGSITVLAARELRKQGKSPLAFSWSPQPESTLQQCGDERDLILEVCRQESIECRFSTLTPQDAERYFEQSASFWGSQPFYPELKHAPAFWDEDCRIMLSGWGGDELTSYDGIRGFLADSLSTRGVAKTLVEMMHIRRNRNHSMRGMLQELALPFLPDALYSRWGSLPLWKKSESLINPDLKDLLAAVRQKRSRWHQRKVRTFQQQYLREGYAQERIEKWAERGEVWGINYLYPVLDKRVIEFVLSLPLEQYCKHGWRRYLFRNAMQGILPPSVQWNKSKYEKSEQASVQAIASMFAKKARERMQEAMRTPFFQRYFDADAVELILREVERNPSGVRHISAIYLYAKFLERTFAAPPQSCS